LSYTSFELSKIKTDKKKYLAGDVITVTCELSNTGDVEGAEVVQVYVGKKNSKVESPLKELKGFIKTSLKKGEAKNIEITVDTDDLAYYDETAGEWKVEKGAYTVYVGTASDKIDKKLKIELE
jgi:beta-glucosidase